MSNHTLFELFGIPVGLLEILLLIYLVLKVVKIIQDWSFRRWLRKDRAKLWADRKKLWSWTEQVDVLLDVDPEALSQIAELAKREKKFKLNEEAKVARQLADDLTAQSERIELDTPPS